jgi:hypothetical protein
MSRCIVNVATGAYVRGQQRLFESEHAAGALFLGWRDCMPSESPGFHDVPYAFKAWALKAALDAEHDTVMWCDASIVPIRDLTPLWEHIEEHGYWICRNGWDNAFWTADSAYSDLPVTREENWKIPHVVATAFGLRLSHPIGWRIFEEYLRLSQTRAFCGPWWNRNYTAPDGSRPYARYQANSHGRRWCEPCGDAKVAGHRHDQTALSAIAWRAGCTLTNAPQMFAYDGGETADTVLVARGI